jgi:hypothetical protein
VDAQFLLKKNKMRLQNFTLSSDQFYGIIRELSSQLNQGNQSVIESLVDKEKSILNDSENRKVVLKELDLDTFKTYNTITSQLDSKAQELVQKAITSHLEYIANKVIDKAQITYESYLNNRKKNIWKKVNHQFMIELIKYQEWHGQTRNRQEKRLKVKNKRKGRRF